MASLQEIIGPRTYRILASLGLISALIAACTRSASQRENVPPVSAVDASPSSTLTLSPTLAPSLTAAFADLVEKLTPTLTLPSTNTPLPPELPSATPFSFENQLYGDPNTVDFPGLAAPFDSQLFNVENHTPYINVLPKTVAQYLFDMYRAMREGHIPLQQEAFARTLFSPLSLDRRTISTSGLGMGWNAEMPQALADALENPDNPPEDVSVISVNGQHIPYYIDTNAVNGETHHAAFTVLEDSARVRPIASTLRALILSVMPDLPQSRMDALVLNMFQKYVNSIALKSHKEDSNDPYSVVVDETCHIDKKPLASMRASPEEDPELQVVGPLEVLAEDDAKRLGMTNYQPETPLRRKQANGIASGVFFATLDVTKFHALVGKTPVEKLTNAQLAKIFSDSLAWVDTDVTQYAVLPAEYTGPEVNAVTGDKSNSELHFRITCGKGGEVVITATPTGTPPPVLPPQPTPSKETPQPTPQETPQPPTGTPISTLQPTPPEVTPAPSTTPSQEASPSQVPPNETQLTPTPITIGTPVQSPTPLFTPPVQQTSTNPPETPQNTPSPTAIFNSLVNKLNEVFHFFGR